MNNILNERAKARVIDSIKEYRDSRPSVIKKQSSYVINFIPMTPSHCYFCVLSEYESSSRIFNCKCCAYRLAHQICTKVPSDYDILHGELIKIKFRTIDINKLFEIYNKYISKMIKNKTVNSFMTSKRDMMIDLVKSFEDDENKIQIEKAVTSIKTKYWNSRKDIKI